MDLTSAILRIPDGLAKYPSDAHWQTKLEAAQNVLFCKELFAQVNTVVPELDKDNKTTYASSEDSDQPRHLPSHIRVFVLAFSNKSEGT